MEKTVVDIVFSEKTLALEETKEIYNIFKEKIESKSPFKICKTDERKTTIRQYLRSSYDKCKISKDH